MTEPYKHPRYIEGRVNNAELAISCVEYLRERFQYFNFIIEENKGAPHPYLIIIDNISEDNIRHTNDGRVIEAIRAYEKGWKVAKGINEP